MEDIGDQKRLIAFGGESPRAGLQPEGCTLVHFVGSMLMNLRWSNQPAAPNAGIASQLAIEHRWTGVGEPGR